MPDLKSELKKLEALKFDDDGGVNAVTLPAAVALPDDQQGGVSVKMYNIIRDNPGCNRVRLVSLASSLGIVKASSSSLINQFVTRGLVRTQESSVGPTYFAIYDKYKPGYVKKNKKADKVVTPKTAVVAPQRDTSVQDLLNNMSIIKARALYDELKKIFGG